MPVPDTLLGYIEYVEMQSQYPRSYAIKDTDTGSVIGGFMAREKAKPFRDRLNTLAQKMRFHITRGEEHFHNVDPEFWP